MESLSIMLQPHKELIGSMASTVTIAQFFAGTLICKNIYQKKTTRGLSAIQFIGGIVLGGLVLKYAFMLEDAAMFQVNMAAIVLHTLYTIFFYIFAENKWEEVLKPLTYGCVLMAVVLGYAGWEDENLIEYRYGLIVTILMLLVLGSPLAELKEILHKKDASSIPFPTTFMAALTSLLWLIYGIILLNNFMIVQNTIGLLLCVVQLFLYFIYPEQICAKKESRKKKTK